LKVEVLMDAVMAWIKDFSGDEEFQDDISFT